MAASLEGRKSNIRRKDETLGVLQIRPICRKERGSDKTLSDGTRKTALVGG